MAHVPIQPSVAQTMHLHLHIENYFSHKWPMYLFIFQPSTAHVPTQPCVAQTMDLYLHIENSFSHKRPIYLFIFATYNLFCSLQPCVGSISLCLWVPLALQAYDATVE